MKTKTKKLWSILFSLAMMVVGFLPKAGIVACAENKQGVYDGGSDEQSAVELQSTPCEGYPAQIFLRSGWYKVSSNLTVSNCIHAGKYYGYDPDSGEVHLIIPSGITLTINTNDQPGLWGEYSLFISGGGTIDINTTSSSDEALWVRETGQLSVSGTKINARATRTYAGVMINGTTTLSGGAEISSNQRLRIGYDVNVSVTGSTIGSDVEILTNSGTTLNVTAGSTLKGKVTGEGTKSIETVAKNL